MQTLTPPTLLSLDQSARVAAIEVLSQRLIDQNECEQGWHLRGQLDALTNPAVSFAHEAMDYAPSYRTGWVFTCNSVRSWDATLVQLHATAMWAVNGLGY